MMIKAYKEDRCIIFGLENAKATFTDMALKRLSERPDNENWELGIDSRSKAISLELAYDVAINNGCFPGISKSVLSSPQEDYSGVDFRAYSMDGKDHFDVDVKQIAEIQENKRKTYGIPKFLNFTSIKAKTIYECYIDVKRRMIGKKSRIIAPAKWIGDHVLFVAGFIWSNYMADHCLKEPKYLTENVNGNKICYMYANNMHDDIKEASSIYLPKY